MSPFCPDSLPVDSDFKTDLTSMGLSTILLRYALPVNQMLCLFPNTLKLNIFCDFIGDFTLYPPALSHSPCQMFGPR